MLLLSLHVMAQNKIVGKITSEDGPLPGVTIVESGTSNGTISDLDGGFSLDTSTPTPTLVFSMVGYKTVKVSPETGKELVINMEVDIKTLEEAVVIGYGTASKKEITSSIATVKGDDLNKMVVGNISESMQGLASGVQIINSGGGPGASPKILIRGIVTNQGTDPLIVVDGVALPQGSNLNFLNPADIKDIQVLKDAAATSIYGTRASNGVVIVNTKRGQGGQTRITATASYGIKGLEKPKMARAEEYAKVMNERATNDGLPEIYDLNAIQYDTDWWEEVHQDYASVQNYNLQLQGGSEKMNYLSSLGYHRTNSHLEKGYWERVSGRVNLDFSVSDKFFIQQDFNPRYEHWENTPEQFWNVTRIDPLTPVYLPVDQRDGLNEYSIYGRSNNFVWNPVAAVRRQFNESHYFSMFSNTNLEYDVSKYLSVSSRLGLTFDQTRNDVYQPKFVIEPNLEDNQQSRVNSRFTHSFSYVWNNLVKYTRSFGLHNVNVTAGVTAERYQRNYLYGSRNDVILDGENYQFLDATTGDAIQANGNEFANSLFSYLARGMYNYNNRYFLSGSFRRDGSSRFPVENQWANFYSLSGAWSISDEDFFSVDWVNNLKLKAGFGQVGNQNIPSSAFLFLVDNESYVFGVNEDRVNTNQITQFGNSKLQWETVQDINVGLEATLLSNKLTVSLDRYVKESKDLLFPTSLPLYTGSPSTIIQNVGSFKSKGWDVTLGYNDTFGELSINLLATINTNESRAVELAPGNERILAQKQSVFGNNFLKITELNQPVGLFYGFETAGIFKNQEEIDAHATENGTVIQPNAKPGDMRFVDQNGDGRLNEDDMTTIGNPFPTLYSGLNLSANYKKWDLTMQWYGSFGNDVYNYLKYFQTSGASNTNIREGLFDEVWREGNTHAVIPRLSANDPNGNFKRSSDYFIEDGSYVRLKNLQLGYTFNLPSQGKIRMYASGQNLFTFTKYTGFDPEVSDDGSGVINGYGMDYGSYPLSRTYVLGLNINF
ncbi:TonB-dependent receptor [Echinicola sediminis]